MIRRSDVRLPASTHLFHPYFLGLSGLSPRSSQSPVSTPRVAFVDELAVYEAIVCSGEKIDRIAASRWKTLTTLVEEF
jgi:hypothetical protein